MIDIKVNSSTLNRFAKIKQRIVDDVNKQFRQRALIMFNDLVRHSPQWSGDFASNWHVHMDPSHYTYEPSPSKGHTTKDSARQMGDMTAIRGTIVRANSVVVDYTKPLYFTNATPIVFMGDLVFGAGQPYKGANYPEVTKLRPVNLLNGKVALSSYLRAKYS